MGISGIDSTGMPLYVNSVASHKSDNTRKVDSANSFQNIMKTAREQQKIVNNDMSWKGDMVVSQPPDYSSFSFDNSVLSKSKEDMTLEEYKQWVMNELSQLPVSGWVQSSFSSGALVIKEEAFENMKNDPEFEEYVLNRVRSLYSANGLPIGSNNVCYEVIGGSPEECYGYAGPVGGGNANIFDKDELMLYHKS